MSKAISRWKPARWAPARMGALPLGLSNISAESYGSAGGGLLLGLMVGKPVGDALKISPSAATGILSMISVGIPLLLGPKNLSRQLSNIFYGAGVGFGASTIFRLLQPLFAPPAPPAAATP
jgi:hypothetical protein